MAIPLRLGDAAEVINVLGLALSSEGLLELLEYDGGIIVDSNKLSVSKDGPQGLLGGLVSVPSVGNTDMKFGNIQEWDNRLRTPLGLALQGITRANYLTQGCNSTGRNKGILG